MFPGVPFETAAIRLEEGDTAVLFTDGIPEARNGNEEEYSEDRFRELVGRHRGLASADLCRAVLEDAHSFAATGQPCDDITLVVIKR
jgi:sigma-B regulation protein RsbU (phosphoserine phosphatase)